MALILENLISFVMSGGRSLPPETGPVLRSVPEIGIATETPPYWTTTMLPSRDNKGSFVPRCNVAFPYGSGIDSDLSNVTNLIGDVEGKGAAASDRIEAGTSGGFLFSATGVCALGAIFDSLRGGFVLL